MRALLLVGFLAFGAQVAQAELRLGADDDGMRVSGIRHRLY